MARRECHGGWRVVDWAGLVEPLEGDPVGPDLSYDAERVAIEDAFSTSASGERADDVNWRDLIVRIRAQAEKTRDLWLGIYWARAGALSGSLEAVAEGAQLLAGLIETHWDLVHPQLDEVGFLGRKSACDGLARHAEFIQPLRRVALIVHPRLGSYSAADLERFEQEADAAEGYGMFRAALEQLDDESVDGAIDTLDVIREAIRRVDRVLTDHAGEDSATDFAPTYQVLAQMRTALARHSRTAQAPHGDAGGDAEGDAASAGDRGAAVTTGAGAGFVAGRIETRDDVLRALDAVADYYRRREPGSAVPLALRRAREWVPKSFIEVLADIAPASMDDARRVLMSQTMIAEAEGE